MASLLNNTINYRKETEERADYSICLGIMKKGYIKANGSLPLAF